ncbi:hypothetical protein AOLI_G00260200 [Acnodon oligacanthus]
MNRILLTVSMEACLNCCSLRPFSTQAEVDLKASFGFALVVTSGSACIHANGLFIFQWPGLLLYVLNQICYERSRQADTCGET